MSDLISRQAAIDIGRNATVDTNPSHFEAHQKFIQFMDDAEISSFGRWQWSNGFNTALTAVGIDLKKLPSAQPESQWIPVTERFPELDQEVLVYAIGKDDGFIGDAVTTISERFIFRLFPSSDGVEEWRSPWQYFDSKYEITHWMPLPEPPKGE